MALLVYLSKSKGARFNRNEYSRISHIPTSSIRDVINRLIHKGLVVKPYPGNLLLSDSGKIAVSTGNEGGENLRREWRRDGENLSQHYTTYKLKISSPIEESKIKLLNPKNIKINRLVNMVQYFAYFETYTLIFNPKTLIIRIHDVLAENTDESNYQTFQKAVEIVEKLEKLKIETSNMILDNVHYARIESYLAEFLEKIDSRYFLDLGNGKKFWIDNSTGPVEEETNDISTRERIDEVMKDMINSKSLLSDVDKMKEVLGMLIQLKAIELMPPQDLTKSIEKKRVDYIG